ncbi:hypothetical protein L7F22_058037 [Adiantum nelumboides]|nr:hypothetical protein [Adiantum nelumboides]
MAASKKREKGGELEAFPWDELPLEVQSSILGRLPLRPLFRCKSVCKLWNSTISSPTFTRRPGNASWLILCPWKRFEFLLGFDFDERSWFKFDMGFLSLSLKGSEEPNFFCCTDMASGLLLLLHTGLQSLFVCNPLTKFLVKLPPFKCIERVVTRGISTSIGICSTSGKSSDLMQALHLRCGNTVTPEVEGEPASYRYRLCSHGYIVVVIGEAKERLAIEAYCPIKNSWDIVGFMPVSFTLDDEHMMECNMMECNGVFYKLMLHPIGMLMIGECDDGMIWRFQAVPDVCEKKICRLLVCQNSIFLLCLTDANKNGFELWRYQTESESWFKLRDFPDCNMIIERRTLLPLEWIYDWAGVGDAFCFADFNNVQFLTYSLSSGLWTLLPAPSKAHVSHLSSALQFVPKLDYTHCLERGACKGSAWGCPSIGEHFQ